MKSAAFLSLLGPLLQASGSETSRGELVRTGCIAYSSTRGAVTQAACLGQLTEIGCNTFQIDLAVLAVLCYRRAHYATTVSNSFHSAVWSD